MQVRCIRAHGTAVPGDVVEVPDGAAFDPYHWEPVAVPPPPPPPPPVTPAAAVTPAKEG